MSIGFFAVVTSSRPLLIYVCSFLKNNLRKQRFVLFAECLTVVLVYVAVVAQRLLQMLGVRHGSQHEKLQGI